jgi:hypothetical protein
VPTGNDEAVDAAVLAQQADPHFEERCCDEAIAIYRRIILETVDRRPSRCVPRGVRQGESGSSIR